MPRYRPERERDCKPGTEHLVRTGLRRPKPSKVRDEWADYCCMEERIPTHKKISSARATNERNALTRAKQKSEASGMERIDVKEFIRMVSPSLLAEFNMLYGQKAVSGDLTYTEKGLLSEMAGLDSYNIYTWLLCFTDSYSGDEIFNAGIQMALEHLEGKEWIRAYKLLKGLVSLYLNDEENEIPHELGRKAIGHLETITRAWVTAHAAEYTDEKLMDQFPMFHGGANITSTSVWSSDGISSMQMFGKVEDLPAITVIGKDSWESNIEGTCRKTSEYIRIRETLRFAIKSLDSAERESFGFDSKLSDEQLVYRLSILFYNLGIGNLLRRHPSFDQFGHGFLNPYAARDQAVTLASLEKEGLEKSFSFARGIFDNDPLEAAGFGTALRFLENNGIIESKTKLLRAAAKDERKLSYSDCAYVLTEKGKELVIRLMSNVAKMEINYEGKRDTTVQSLVDDIFG